MYFGPRTLSWLAGYGKRAFRFRIVAVKLQRLVAAVTAVVRSPASQRHRSGVSLYLGPRRVPRDPRFVVQASVAAADEAAADSHARSGQSKSPNPEQLAHDLNASQGNLNRRL